MWLVGKLVFVAFQPSKLLLNFYIYVHIRLKTRGSDGFLDLEYICMGCITCLVSGVTSSAERNTAVCTNARIIMHVCKRRDR